ncbi:unnamed protein product [Owenia fusiformis]|uniref:Uncharacterized protein n=1 Tax=Owenia fusiformis TaxID=6347 RepID=A0A8J1XKL9_OWEFU|nr:unnamed protein product [Owenia fusiformis]
MATNASTVPIGWTNLTRIDVAMDRHFRHVDDQRLWLFGAPVVLVLGTIGNLLCIAVLLRKKLRAQSWCWYLIALAVVDLVALYTTTLDWWIRSLTGVYIGQISPGTCILEIFLTFLADHFSAWILVAVACERVFYIYFPVQSKGMCTRKCSFIVIAVIGFVLILLNLHIIWSADLKERHGAWSCFLNKEFSLSWSWIDMCFASLFPFVAMAMANGFLIKKLSKLKTSPNGNMRSKNRQLIVMILTVTVAFVLLTLPLQITIVVLIAQTKIDPDDTETINKMHSAVRGAQFIHQFNSVINFVLYYASNSRFRKELKDWWCSSSSTYHSRTNRDT